MRHNNCGPTRSRRFLASLLPALAVASSVLMAPEVFAADAPAPEPKSLKIVLAQGVPPESSVVVELIGVPAGEFLMGSPEDEPLRDKDEIPHKVRISRPFYLGKTELTQAQWRAAGMENLSRTVGDDRPVTMCSWTDATDFMAVVNRRFGDQLPKGLVFRLPTEAEWEYACRAGTTGPWSFGANAALADAHMWHDGNSRGPQPVGGKLPNAWGFHDMLGNVYEWCWDYAGGAEINGDITIDPLGLAPGHSWLAHVIKGGSYHDPASKNRIANRVGNGYTGKRRDHMGLRLAVGAPLPELPSPPPPPAPSPPPPQEKVKLPDLSESSNDLSEGLSR